MNKSYRYFIVLVAILLGGCSFIKKIEKITKPVNNKVGKYVTEQKEISIVCNRRNIDEYIDKGWLVVKTEHKEVPCTWKTKKSKRGCNLELDKGCRLTVPDQMGKNIIYYLERKSEILSK